MFKDNERPIGIDIPGAQGLQLTSFEGEEHMSGLFQFQLNLLAHADDPVVEPNDVIGKQIDFWVRRPKDNSERFFNGHISWFSYLGTGDRGHIYQAEVVPWLWFLTQSSECRVYETAESKTAKDVVDAVFSNHGFTDYRWDVKRTLMKREFCVQYMESHCDFVSRLLEYEGIFYYFEHEKGKHTLVLADHANAGKDLDHDYDVTLLSNLAQPELTDKITAWQHEYRFTAGKFDHTDYDFLKPSTSLSSKVNSILKTPKIKSYERYEYNGFHKDAGDGKAVADVRMEQIEAAYDAVVGGSSCREFSPGGRFELSKHHTASEEGTKWLLTSVRHSGDVGGSFVSGVAPADKIYSNQFRCIPASTQYRAERSTPTPRIHGIQTALVVGPSGEEIYTDKHGRIKVQFHWDREGKKDDKSSFWVRFSHPWTGKNWGMVSVPRIGQEVVIDFLDGDPDRPLCTGMLYNAETMPPYGLPDNKTQTGIKTRSSPKGSSDNFNELRFEDKKDEEEIYVHAEKDFNCVIENNETRKVGFDKKKKGDQTVEIYNDQNLTVGEGSGKGNQTIQVEMNRDLKVVKGNETHTVQAGNRTVSVSDGEETKTVKKDQSLEVSDGNQTTKIGKGNQAIELGMGNRDIKVKMGNLTTKCDLGKVTYEAMQSIELKVGGNSIKIDQTGIVIKGLMVEVKGDISAKVEGGAMAEVKGGGMLTLKGAVTMIN